MHIVSALLDPSRWSWPWVAAAWTLHAFVFVLICIHCLRSRREATSTLLWIFLSLSFPIIGPLLYVSIGVDRVPDKGFRKTVTNEVLLAERKAREADPRLLAYWLHLREAVSTQPATPFGTELNRALNKLFPDHPLLGGNCVVPLVTGDEAFPQMFDAIRGARHHVHLQSFMICGDSVGRDLLDLLAEKAAAGIEVRVMYDRFGSTQAHLSGFFRRYRHVPNLEIVGWTQANPLKRQFQINLRNHRKTMVIDGHTAFCGGMNIKALNVTTAKRPPDRDYHFMLRGPAALELQYTFMRDWYFMTGYDPKDLLKEEYFPEVPASGNALVRVINSGPSSEMEIIADVFFTAIVAAQKQILIATPYFVPTHDIVRALRTAALRGVDVRLIVPEKNNHFYAGLAGRALYEELLEAGVRVFLRQPPFMHAKALVVDDAFALVGTANLDVRSLRLNYETNLVVYDDTFVNQMKEIVLDDEAHSRALQLEAWRRRPLRQRCLENLAHLMKPVL